MSKTSSSGRTPSSRIRCAIARSIAGRVDHHVVAAGGEVHRAAVERADLRAQLLDVHEPLARRRSCPSRRRRPGAARPAPPSTRSPPIPAVRLRTTSTSAARTRSTTSRYSAGSREPWPVCGSRTWMWATAAPARAASIAAAAMSSGVDRDVVARARRVARAGHRAGDEDLLGSRLAPHALAHENAILAGPSSPGVKPRRRGRPCCPTRHLAFRATPSLPRVRERCRWPSASSNHRMRSA